MSKIETLTNALADIRKRIKSAAANIGKADTVDAIHSASVAKAALSETAAELEKRIAAAENQERVDNVMADHAARLSVRAEEIAKAKADSKALAGERVSIIKSVESLNETLAGHQRAAGGFHLLDVIDGQALGLRLNRCLDLLQETATSTPAELEWRACSGSVSAFQNSTPAWRTLSALEILDRLAGYRFTDTERSRVAAWLITNLPAELQEAA